MYKNLKEIEFIVNLGREDRFREKHIGFKNKIIAFAVQYETLIKGDWLPIVRYNTSHGYAHRDLYKKHGGVKKTPLFINNYNDALTFAESDLKTNWKIYKGRFLKGD